MKSSIRELGKIRLGPKEIWIKEAVDEPYDGLTLT
jgi:hypothetical protein